MAQRTKNILKRMLIALAIIIAVLLVLGVWWVSDYYHADAEALAVVADADGDADGVTVQAIDGAIAFVPDDPTAGLVFYPGAKVQPEAYAPLMKNCAERGILCIIVRPPLNLALLDVNAAENAQRQFPDIDTWILAGHSLGGIAASDFASSHPDQVDAIVFLASYPQADIAALDKDALSVVGTEDLVLNRGNYEAARNKLPADAEELVIEGGNHANFGNYGNQAGDGTALVSRDNQQEETAQAIEGIAKAA